MWSLRTNEVAESQDKHGPLLPHHPHLSRLMYHYRKSLLCKSVGVNEVMLM